MSKLKMPTRGRTGRGKWFGLLPEDHYLRRLCNRIDGADQRARKEILAALGFDPAMDPTREEIVARVKDGIKDFDALVKLAGEKLPGCGAIVPFAVGPRVAGGPDVTEALGEDQARAHLQALGAENFYFTGRGVGHADQKKKRWPGFGKIMFSLSPGDSRALISAVKSGAMTPEAFRGHLRELSGQAAVLFRDSTRIGGAKRGCEARLVAWHLEQGCLHCHMWFSDIDIYDPARPRIGLFSTAGQAVGAKPRLTLNSLGIAGVALRRHRAAGHLAPVHVAESGVKSDFSILEIAEFHRAGKGLGPCWDAQLSDAVDGFWAKVFSAANLVQHLKSGHAAWAKDWQHKRATKIGQLRGIAKSVMPTLAAEAEVAAAKKIQEAEEGRKAAVEAATRATRLAGSVATPWLRKNLSAFSIAAKCILDKDNGGAPPKGCEAWFRLTARRVWVAIDEVVDRLRAGVSVPEFKEAAEAAREMCNELIDPILNADPKVEVHPAAAAAIKAEVAKAAALDLPALPEEPKKGVEMGG